MKKFAGVLLAVFLIFFLFAQANAYWEAGHLYQVYYTPAYGPSSTPTCEYAKDLGPIASLGTSVAVDLPTVDGSVGFFGYDGSTEYYFATTELLAPKANKNMASGFSAGFNQIMTYYSSLDTDADGILNNGVAGNSGSYWVRMNSSTTPGQYAG